MALSCLAASFNHRNAFKLLGASAADADQMMVIAMVTRAKLKATSTFRELQLLQKSHLHQKPEGAVNRGEGHPGFRFQQVLMHILRTEMGAGTDPLKQIEHSPTLWGETPTVLVKPTLQRLLHPRRRRSC